MAKTNSTMLPLGTQAPLFDLPGCDGKRYDLSQFKNANALVVVFMCNHCPYVIHVRPVMMELFAEYQKKGVAVVAISSNDPIAFPEDNFEKMVEDARKYSYAFPYLYDETQEVAKAYRAACTPDFFVFGRERTLVYRGQMDDSRPGNGVPVTGWDLRTALDALHSGRPAPELQKPSMGCNIKWKEGNEPPYFFA